MPRHAQGRARRCCAHGADLDASHMGDLEEGPSERTFVVRLPLQRRPEDEPLRVVLWLPANATGDHVAELMAWCTRRSYLVVSVVRDDGLLQRWTDVQAMLGRGEAQVVVARRWEDYPTERIPRVEAMDWFGPNPPPDVVRPLRRRRPRPLR